MRQSCQQIQLALHHAQSPLRRDEELYVAGAPEEADGGAAQVAQQRDAGDKERGQDEQDQGRAPGGDFYVCA